MENASIGKDFEKSAINLGQFKTIKSEYSMEEIKESGKSQHQTSYSHSKKFGCEQCEKSFTQAHNLKAHVKSAHENIKDLNCDLCPYASVDRGNLARHMRNHHNVDR